MQYNHPWIDAYWEPNQGISTFKNCLALVDLEANTEFKLVCVNFTESQAYLKIFKGSSLYAETVLPEIPSAVTTLYTDSSEPRIPAVAVACGSQVLVYRNVRPYFKFTLPLMENEDAEYTNVETDIWRQKFDAHQLVQLLQELSLEYGFSNLSTPSQKLLAMNSEERENFLKMPGHVQIKKQVTITNMIKIPKMMEGEKVVECLIVTTESSHLFVLDPESFTVIEQRKIPGVTTHLAVQGVYAVDYFLIFSVRYGSVYKLKRDVSEAQCLTNLASLPVDLALDFNRFVTVNMDSTFQSYTLKGAKEWSILLDGAPTAISVIPAHISESTFVIACNSMKKGLLEGVVYMYKGTEVLHILHVQEPIQAFIYGPYGFGEQGFIFNTTGGGLSIKLLKRTANFGTGDKCAVLGSSLHHNIKLLVPKKSRIFVEQTLREREQCKEMYSWFQKTWQGMKVLTAESYLNALQKATISDNQSLKLTAQVLGLGPRLKLLGQIQNLSEEEELNDISISFIYDADVYTIDKSYINIPFVVPHYEYKFATFINCSLNVTSSINLVVSNRDNVILSAVVNMPPESIMSFAPLIRSLHTSTSLSYLQKLARVRVVCNSPIGKQAMAEGKPPKIIHVYKRTMKGTIGDKVLLAIKGQMKKAIIVGCVRTQAPNIPRFDTNNVVLIENNGTPIGTRIHVPIPHMLRTILKEKSVGKGIDYTKLLAIAPRFV